MAERRSVETVPLHPHEIPGTPEWRTMIVPDIFSFPGVFPESAWTEHVPFAYWLARAASPRVFVELGTHGGMSYFSFCHAIQLHQQPGKCYAIDTWQGDQQAGFYDESMFNAVRKSNEPYASFSTLLRMRFDDAASIFADGSIDLLHFDGLHRYEEVRHDAAVWLPKLSERGIALFHDTAEKQSGFGVYRLWEELSERYPSFAFTHGHGLGVLGVGKNLPEQVTALFNFHPNSMAARTAKAAFERLGRLYTIEQAYLREHTDEPRSFPNHLALQPLTEMYIQVYWKSGNDGYSEEHSVVQQVQLDELPSHCRFTLSIPANATALRIDPGFAPGICYLHYLSIQDESGATMYAWPRDLERSESRDLLLLNSRLYEKRILLINTGPDPIVEWSLPAGHPPRVSMHVCLSGIHPDTWIRETSRINAGGKHEQYERSQDQATLINS